MCVVLMALSLPGESRPEVDNTRGRRSAGTAATAPAPTPVPGAAPGRGVPDAPQAADGAGPAIRSLGELRSLMAAHVAAPRFAAASWGVKVVSLATGATLFEHQAGKLLKPASNAKVYTGALALDRFGPDHRLRTSIFARCRPGARGVLDGDLIVFGRGDPSLAARFHGGNSARSLDPLVDAIAATGIRRVEGGLVGDESYFRGLPFGTGWAWDDLQYDFGAEVSALSVDDNTVELCLSPGNRPGEPCRLEISPSAACLQCVNRITTADAGTQSNRWIRIRRPPGGSVVELTGQLPLGDSNCLESVSVPRPARWFLARLAEALAARGIRVMGAQRVVDEPEAPSLGGVAAPRVELGWAESRPMAELVERMMKASQNLYAQLLLLQAGVEFAADGAGAGVDAGGGGRAWTTEEAGLAALREFAGRAGVPPGQMLLEEGAGLSHGSAVTAHATVTLLRFMSRHREASHFLQSLPLAGVDRALRRRFAGTAAAGRVRAKSGSLHHVSALAGYVMADPERPLAFAIMLNHYQPPAGFPPAAAEVDHLVCLLARFDNGR
ncbi:MAG: D-alanyl-D-alanine carboxypeptidase/D-alanyl-D-alanine-endopeptidase [Verrucomicrobia bacterium]|nr:D-alanyl-D-alanine carboxypeptidase/D-alanyl-D-alanine-endopeptidase [Verrucomicrobiota bacterium]